MPRRKAVMSRFFSLAICRNLCYAIGGATSTPVGGSPRFSGVIYFSCPQSNGEGVADMVTWEGIFQFCMVIATVIALVIQANNKEK